MISLILAEQNRVFQWLGVSGTIAKGEVHHVLNDFAIKLVSLVKAGIHTGYLCDTKREHDKETRY